MNNISKFISKISSYGCWIAIALLSFILIDSIYSPWQKTYFGITLPKIDPLVQIVNIHAIPAHPKALKKYLKGDSNFDTPKAYSVVESQAYHSVFYRSYYKGYPVKTISILILRILTYITLAIFFILLAQIFQSIYKGDPFTPNNYKGLFYMGFSLILLPFIRSMHSYILADILSKNPKLMGWEITASFQSFWWLPVGLLFVVFGYVYKELVRIHEELKLTV